MEEKSVEWWTRESQVPLHTFFSQFFFSFCWVQEVRSVVVSVGLPPGESGELEMPPQAPGAEAYWAGGGAVPWARHVTSWCHKWCHDISSKEGKLIGSYIRLFCSRYFCCRCPARSLASWLECRVTPAVAISSLNTEGPASTVGVISPRLWQ